MKSSKVMEGRDSELGTRDSNPGFERSSSSQFRVPSSGSRSGSQQRKQDDVAYGVLVRQEHRQPVDPDAFSRRGGHPVAERLDEVAVIGGGLEVSLLTLLGLPPEARLLLHRVV